MRRSGVPASAGSGWEDTQRGEGKRASYLVIMQSVCEKLF